MVRKSKKQGGAEEPKMADAIKELVTEKGLSKDVVKMTIETTLKAAYKKTYGTNENAIVVFEEDSEGIPCNVKIYSRKEVVDGVYDPVTEIELEDALKLNPECEVGDELDLPENPKNFERAAVSAGKQTAHQGFNESCKQNLYKEFKDKVGGIIIGYYQRERRGTIFVDLGKIEGVLPQKYQSPREHYEKGDRIRAYVENITNTSSGVQLTLSRTSPELVRAVLETEVPEIADGTVEIYKIVREAGYRTKIAVFSHGEIDPVGACVGLKGVRIQNVIQELLGEKIDVLKYDSSPVEFIKNALSPAEISRVIILDREKKQALAVAAESQFSLAIGKQGLNVRLANRLCDWNIDVKTEEQVAEMDLGDIVSRQSAEALFNDNYDEITTLLQLPGIDERVANLLSAAGIKDVQQFVDNYENINVEGVSKEDLEKANAIINENFSVVDEDEHKIGENEVAPDFDAQQKQQQKIEKEDLASEKAFEENDTEEDEYFCPECGAKITLDMTHCPNCGVEFEFQEEEE